jgi:thiol:disulfide interchange protein DsbD
MNKSSVRKIYSAIRDWLRFNRQSLNLGILALSVVALALTLPGSVALFLWAIILILSAIYLGAVDSIPLSASGWRKFSKGVGVALLVYGILMLVGVASNGNDPLNPLSKMVCR